MSRISKAMLAALLLMPASFGLAPLDKQEPRQGPVKPPQRDIKRLPAETTETPPFPLEEMIQRFTAKEDELKRAHEQFNYRLTVRVQEYAEDGTAAGEWQVASEVVFKPDGSRVGRILEEKPSTLKRVSFQREDLDELASIPQFILTSDLRPRYDITYKGRQPVDELNTFIFRVQPKRLERKMRQFDGLVWVDDRDFAAVKFFGKFVTELGEDSIEGPFKLSEGYREFTAGQYWFPTYVRSEDTIRTDAGEARVRLTLRMTDYQPRQK